MATFVKHNITVQVCEDAQACNHESSCICSKVTLRRALGPCTNSQFLGPALFRSLADAHGSPSWQDWPAADPTLPLKVRCGTKQHFAIIDCDKAAPSNISYFLTHEAEISEKEPLRGQVG